MRTIEIHHECDGYDFLEARHEATEFARATLGESVCMSWYDRARDQESPAHASECHGSCEIPGYVEYAMNRGAELKVIVDDGAYIFCFRPLGEFADV